MPKQILKPDLDFIGHIIRAGGESVKKCFQCANCSAVCLVTPDDRPFPRKEMVMAQWGLKEELAADPDIWLCHGCNDCSTYCPRGAKPGEVLNVIRNYLIPYFAVPNFLAKFFSWPIYLLFILAILVFLYLLPISFTDARIIFFVVTGLVFVVTVIAVKRFWKNISKFESKLTPLNPHSNKPQIKKGFVESFISSLVDVLKHTNFKRCQINKGNYLAHLLIFYGFISLFITCVGAQIYSLTPAGLPLPLTNPLKILGIGGGFALFFGLTLIIYRRLFKKNEAAKATYYDWFFIVLLYIVTITGISLPWLRLVGAITLVHQIYLLHLVFVFALFAYAPFSKFIHPVYRILAMTYVKQIGRELKPMPSK